MALTPFVIGPTRLARLIAKAMALLLPLSIATGHILSLSNWLYQSSFAGEWGGDDPEFVDYMIFYLRLRVIEATAAAVAVALVLLRAKVVRRRIAVLAVGLTTFGVATMELWVGWLKYSPLTDWLTNIGGYDPELEGTSYDVNTDVRAFVLIPALIILAAGVRLWRSHLANRPLRQLTAPVTPSALQDALRHGAKDSALEILYWAPATQSLVDINGLAAEPKPGDQLFTTVVKTRTGGESLALITTSRDPERTEATANLLRDASRALVDTREQVLAHAHAIELEMSRQRMAETTLRDRRRLERDLHDGAQQRLLALSTRLALIRGHVDPATEPVVDAALSELREALGELRDLARGVHPAILSQKGIKAAVESMADRMPIPVEIDIPDRRCPPTVEGTIYFVICEALTNTVKHSAASRASVRVELGNNQLQFAVRDDGRGGADVGRGAGLQNLKDRISAVGGEIRVDSSPGSGTTITGNLPCTLGTAAAARHAPATAHVSSASIAGQST